MPATTIKHLHSFDHVVKDFPDSNKVPDAILKQAFVYYDLGEWEKTRSLLQKLRSQYPDSPSASLALKRLQQMNATGL